MICCASRHRCAPAWSAPRSCSSGSAPIHGRTAWHWHCARSAASSARCSLDWLEQPALRRQATAELNKGEVLQCARQRRLLPSSRSPARPNHRGPAASSQRTRPGHRRDRTVEHRLSRPCTRRLASGRRARAGYATRSPRAARLAAHQPHRRLPLGRIQQSQCRRVQAAPHTTATPGRRMTILVRATDRAILPVLCGDPAGHQATVRHSDGHSSLDRIGGRRVCDSARSSIWRQTL